MCMFQVSSFYSLFIFYLCMFCVCVCLFVYVCVCVCVCMCVCVCDLLLHSFPRSRLLHRLAACRSSEVNRGNKSLYFWELRYAYRVIYRFVVLETFGDYIVPLSAGSKLEPVYP